MSGSAVMGIQVEHEGAEHTTLLLSMHIEEA